MRTALAPGLGWVAWHLPRSDAAPPGTKPDPRTWREQIIGICGQIRDQYLRYPGISQAALAVVPTNTETLRVNEGMLAVVLAGGVGPQTAAWAVGALSLYVSAFCLETSLKDGQAGREGWAASHDELLSRFAALPGTFPHTKRALRGRAHVRNRPGSVRVHPRPDRRRPRCPQLASRPALPAPQSPPPPRSA
jgi:hypothetical protein